MPTVPQFSLERQTQALLPEFERAAARVLASGRYAQGPECEALEAGIVAALAAPAPTRLGACACSSGTDALHLALRAVGVGAGDVVLTTPFTFFATASAAVLCGARPEFVDIQPWDFNLDPESLAAALRRPRTGRVAAIVPVHLYGGMAPMPAIVAAAANAGVPVVEDAAQAIGAWLPAADGARRPAGAWGAAGCFSFYPTKNLGALGEAGMVVGGDEAVLERVRRLRVHGSRRRYEHEEWGWNGRLSELQAALLRVKLPHLERWNDRRRALAARYERLLLASGVATLAAADRGAAGSAGERDAEVVLPLRTPGHVFHQYVIRARHRDELRRFLSERSIGAEVYYPVPLHHQPVLREACAGQRFPHAERAAAEVLALPMFPELLEEEVDAVCAAIGDFYGARLVPQPPPAVAVPLP